MTNFLERLKSLENQKLIDVVKNYRQYGYDEAIRTEALRVLNDRGIGEFELRLKGDFQNSSYDEALVYYHDFKRNSKIAFFLYLYIIFGHIVLSVLLPYTQSFNLFLSVISLIALIGYLIFILLSFLNQSNFYKIIGKKYGADSAIVYFLVGMPFYIFMFFYFRKQMKEQMNLIN